MVNSIVLVVDGDNTMWDCNAIFERAQLAMLEPFIEAKLISQPDLAVLRNVDRELMNKFSKAEYDFRFLPIALLHHFQGKTIQVAIEAIAQNTNQLLTEASYQAFTREMACIPELFPDALCTLKYISEILNPLSLILFSGGQETRLDTIINFHNIRTRGIFDEIILKPKSQEVFEQIKKANTQATFFIMVGDSLQSDVKPARQAGFTTVYKPAGFKGNEIPTSIEEEPHYTIQLLSELPEVLMKIVNS